MEAASCIFCKIIRGEIPAKTAFENEEFLAFHDIQPQAPVHLLVIPRRHIASLDEAFPEEGASDPALLGRMLEVGARLARSEGLVAGGYRAVLNTGPHAGQTVFHIHLHILGGGPLGSFGSR